MSFAAALGRQPEPTFACPIVPGGPFSTLDAELALGARLGIPGELFLSQNLEGPFWPINEALQKGLVDTKRKYYTRNVFHLRETVDAAWEKDGKKLGKYAGSQLCRLTSRALRHHTRYVLIDLETFLRAISGGERPIAKDDRNGRPEDLRVAPTEEQIARLLAYCKARGAVAVGRSPHGLHVILVFSRALLCRNSDDTELANAVLWFFKDFLADPQNANWYLDPCSWSLVRAERACELIHWDREAMVVLPDTLPTFESLLPAGCSLLANLTGKGGRSGGDSVGTGCGKTRTAAGAPRSYPDGPFVGPCPRGGNSAMQEERRARHAYTYKLARESIESGAWLKEAPAPAGLLEHISSETGIKVSDIQKAFAKIPPHGRNLVGDWGLQLIKADCEYLGPCGQIMTRLLPKRRPGPRCLLDESGHSFSLFALLGFTLEQEIALLLGVHRQTPTVGPERALRLTLADVLNLDLTRDWEIESEHGDVAYDRALRLTRFHPSCQLSVARALVDLLNAIDQALRSFGVEFEAWLLEDCPRRREKFPIGGLADVSPSRVRAFLALLSPGRYHTFEELMDLVMAKGVCTRTWGAAPATGWDPAVVRQLRRVVAAALDSGELKERKAPIEGVGGRKLRYARIKPSRAKAQKQKRLEAKKTGSKNRKKIKCRQGVNSSSVLPKRQTLPSSAPSAGREKKLNVLRAQVTADGLCLGRSKGKTTLPNGRKKHHLVQKFHLPPGLYQCPVVHCDPRLDSSGQLDYAQLVCLVPIPETQVVGQKLSRKSKRKVDPDQLEFLGGHYYARALFNVSGAYAEVWALLGRPGSIDAHMTPVGSLFLRLYGRGRGYHFVSYSPDSCGQDFEAYVQPLRRQAEDRAVAKARALKAGAAAKSRLEAGTPNASKPTPVEGCEAVAPQAPPAPQPDETSARLAEAISATSPDETEQTMNTQAQAENDLNEIMTRWGYTKGPDGRWIPPVQNRPGYQRPKPTPATEEAREWASLAPAATQIAPAAAQDDPAQNDAAAILAWLPATPELIELDGIKVGDTVLTPWGQGVVKRIAWGSTFFVKPSCRGELTMFYAPRGTVAAAPDKSATRPTVTDR